MKVYLSVPESLGEVPHGQSRVKGSKALLGFTEFETTCTIELPVAYAGNTMAYYNAVWQGLGDAQVPYTLHWGQINNFTPERVRNMYGE
jgi:hypothetical protein